MFQFPVCRAESASNFNRDRWKIYLKLPFLTNHKFYCFCSLFLFIIVLSKFLFLLFAFFFFNFHFFKYSTYVIFLLFPHSISLVYILKSWTYYTDSTIHFYPFQKSSCHLTKEPLQVRKRTLPRYRSCTRDNYDHKCSTQSNYIKLNFCFLTWMCVLEVQKPVQRF